MVWKTVTSIAALAWLSISLAEAAPSVRAQVDRSTVSVGESFTLSIVVEGLPTANPPSLPAMPGVQVAGVSPSQQIMINNGQTSTKHVFDYQLVPGQAGDLTIPAMAVQAGGRVFATEPIVVKVLPQGAQTAAGTNLAFLKLVAPKKEFFVGEAFPLELHLYWQQGHHARDARMPTLPAEGFSVGQFGEPQQTPSVVNGVPHNVAIFRTAVTPLRTGDLTLGPAECQLNILVPIQGRRRGIFDDFFGPNMQARPTVARSEAQAIRVLPLPAENVPETFNGAIGTYNLSLSAGPTNLAVGDPITVRVQISGRGLLDRLNLPPQPQWRDFNAYTPNSKTDPADPLGLSGTKTFEQVIIPQNHEIQSLPPFQFTFFDPNARAYRTLKSQAVPLGIRPSISAAAPPMLTNVAGPATPPPADDIIHIRARFEPLAMASPPLIQQPWFLALQAIPMVAWIGLFVTRKRKEKLANNPRLRRRREAAARVREGLRELPQLAAARDTEGFFATAFRLLQEQLGARLDMPASGITEAVIEQRLRDGSLAESTLSELHEVFQACNQARYAPQRSSEELSSYIPRLEAVLREL